MIFDPRNPELSEGHRIGGYTITRIAELPEIRGIYYALDHEKTGARHVHVSIDDPENTFSVAFKTVPQDSTGVAHILEHTALCGSERYPVRDPFFSMIKRSLNTFMNAFTASDWTMYPFATANEKDFYNLLGVYLDASFFPNLDGLSFQQEGHRLEYDDDGTLQRMGVVYNEMKGAMSAQNQVMGRGLLKALYPDVTYGNNSGGAPEDIPTLTHADLVAFHKVHYHPSNAYFFTYGDLPLERHLKEIEDRVLTRFDRIDPKTDVPNQPRWDAPRTVTERYPAAQGPDLEKECQVAVAWLTPDILDTRAVLGFALLDQILLGNAAAPLRKALIDSKLGTALSDGTGFDPDNRDTSFAAGLKGARAADAQKIESLVIDTLRQEVATGFDRELIDAAIHQLEFHRKEISNVPYPYGLKMLLGFGATWFHGGDPVDVLLFDADLSAIKEGVSKGYFEDLVRTHLIENPHRVRLVLTPDTQLQQQEVLSERSRLDAIEKTLTDEERQTIREEAKTLASLQEAEEDLQVLPTLMREDIAKEIKRLSATDQEGAVARYDVATSGIFYATAAFGVGHLEERLLQLVPIFCHILPRVGTKDRDYLAIAKEMDAVTGGIGMGSNSRTAHDADGSVLPIVTLSGKALYRNRSRMFDLMREFTSGFSFENTERMKTLLLEYRAGMEGAVVQNGHRLAMSLASRSQHPTAALSEIWHGVHQLQFVKDITDALQDGDRAEETLEVLSRQLTEMAGRIFTKENLKLALVAEQEEMDAARPDVEALLAGMGAEGDNGFCPPVFSTPTEPVREGWTTASAVSFVAASFVTPRYSHPDAPVLSVIAKLLRSLYLHREIREKGGAYGGFALFNAEDGLFSFASYRDPHIGRTLDTFKGACEFLNSGAFTETDIKEAILQVCSELDRPDTPFASAKKSFFRDLVGLSDAERVLFKERLLAVDKERVAEVAGLWFTPENAEKGVAVITGSDQLTAANETENTRLTVHQI